MSTPKTPSEPRPAAANETLATRATPPASMTKEAPADRLLAPGTQVGRYEIIELMGRGGMGEVYRATDPQLSRQVALKLVRSDHRVASDMPQARLLREAHALAQLSHPNVVAAFDAGTYEGAVFMAMELIEGVSLRAWLTTPRPQAQILRVLVAAGRGLVAAHTAGVVHRDFKPDNVMVSPDGRVRVVDFGLARTADDGTGASEPGVEPTATTATAPAGSEQGADPTMVTASVAGPSGSRLLASELTVVGTIVGTPGFMAPEQLIGAPIDVAADQFSFAATVFRALVGTKPFAARTIAEYRSALLLRKRTEWPPRIAGRLRRVVDRGLAIQPRERYPTLRAMVDALEHATRSRRGWLAIPLALAVVATLGIALTRAKAAPPPSCQIGADRVATVWGDPAREETRAAFARSHLIYAADTSALLQRRLDDYAATLAAAIDDTCETHARGYESDEVLDLRMACYDGRLRQLGALVGMLRQADQDTVKSAVEATRALQSLTDCADVAGLREPMRRPIDPVIAARTDELEQRLAVVQATIDLGKFAQASKLADQLRTDAESVPYPPLWARIDFARARASRYLENDQVLVILRDAYAEAMRGHDDRTLKDAASLAAYQAIYLRDQRSFDIWSTIAQAAIDRGHEDIEAQRRLDHYLCHGFFISGKFSLRFQCLQQFAAKYEPQAPLSAPEVTSLSYAAADAGRPEAALTYARQARALSSELNGPMHPSTISAATSVCLALRTYGDLATAERECRSLLATANQIAPDNNTVIGRIELSLANILFEAGKLDEARAMIEHASSIYPGQQDELDRLLAEIMALQGHHARALEIARARLELTMKHNPPLGAFEVFEPRVQLAAMLLARGDAADARALVELAFAEIGDTEISEFTRAQVELMAAEVLWTDPRQRARAFAMAQQARARYAAGPPTSMYERRRAAVDQWLAQHPLAGLAAPGGR